MAIDERLPPCIVWGLETQIGLNIVRELGRSGVRVVGVTHDPYAIGLYSRYLWRAVVVAAPCSAELPAALIQLGEELGDCCLLAVSETNLAWLSERPLAFGKVRPILPPTHALRAVLNKQATLSIARDLGQQIPETVQPLSMQHAQEVAETFSFPAVLKWSDPHTAAPLLRPYGIQVLKSEYAYTSEEFLGIMRRYEPAGVWPLVQEYCPGYGLGQFFYMHAGQPIRRFQHRRVAEWPPEGGFSSVCEAVSLDSHQELQEKSIALLQAIGWDGVAMVEYRYDPCTDTAKLMEINGRYWGSFPLAVHSGAGFALLSYRVHGGLTTESLPLLRNDIRCRMVTTELKRLFRIFLHPSLIPDRNFKVRRMSEVWRFVSDYFRPTVRYYVWSADDCRPFFADISNVLRKLWRKHRMRSTSPS